MGYKKLHSPNQAIPSFTGWKRVNLEPLNNRAVNQPVKNQPVTESITKHNTQEKQKKEQDQRRWHISDINGQSKIEITDNRNDKQQEYKKVIYRCCSKNDVKNIHWKFHSPNQTIPIFMRGKRINLQPLIKESIIITKHDSQEKQKKEQD